MTFSDLVGKTLTEVRGAEKGSERITLVCDDGSMYAMFHEQDCCENVVVEDVCGDVDDLIGRPIVKAEESTSNDRIGGESDDSWTWTFYHLATAHGYVTIRWLGESNGYYGEEVEFRKVGARD